MNYDLIFFIIFCILVYIFYQKNKSKFEIQGKIFALYRTQLGLKLMETFSHIPERLKRILKVISISVGFAGMAFIFYFLIIGTINLFLIPEATPTFAPVLPGVTIPGLPKLSFFHWIISIFIVAIVHEFSHGVFARFSKIKIKSSGFAFMGPILAAFVEPDENELKKKSKKDQLAVFSAGPFSNIVLGIIIFLVAVFLIAPAESSMLELKGVQVAGFEEGYPAINSGLSLGDEIIAIDDTAIKSVAEFTNYLQQTKSNQELRFKTQNNTFSLTTVEHPKGQDFGYIGIIVASKEADLKESIREKYGGLPWVFFWISKLLFWLYVISLGVGLFNLLPLGPLDGGRMFYVFLMFFTKDEKKIKKIWTTISIFILLLIVINLWPYIQKLLLWIFSPIISLIF